MTNIPIVNAGISYVNGLELQFNNFNDFTIFPGAARDSTDTNDIILNSSVVVSKLTTGANGRDFGPLLPSTLYSVHVIGDSTGFMPTAGIMASGGLNPPALPAGYDMYRRIGWIRTDTALGQFRIFQFVQVGSGTTRTYFYDSGVPILTGGTATTWTGIGTVSLAPPFRTKITLDIIFTPAVAADTIRLNTSTSTSTASIFTYGSVSATAGQRATATIPIARLGFGSGFQYILTGGSVNLNIQSYDDNLTNMVSSLLDL